MWHRRLEFHNLGFVRPITTPVLTEKMRCANYPTLDNHVRLSNGTVINADWVTDNLILTQAPPPAAFLDFWCMVLEFNIDTVVCLAQPDAPNQLNVYWPPHGSTMQLGGDDVHVSTITEFQVGSFVHRTMLVADRAHGTCIAVKHVHMLNWQDGGVPQLYEVQHLNEFIDHSAHVTLIHCGAGVGRAGTLAAIQMLRRAPTGIVDPFSVVAELRTRRVGAVHTLQQYMFVCEFSEIEHRRRHHHGPVQRVPDQEVALGHVPAPTTAQSSDDLDLQTVRGTPPPPAEPDRTTSAVPARTAE